MFATAAPADASLATMRCADVDPMMDVELVVRQRGSFRIAYLPGTAGERDLDRVVALREAALVQIMAALGVVERPELRGGGFQVAG